MALEQFRLDGQVAIVTGAGRGVGAGIARVLAEAGATILPASPSFYSGPETMLDLVDTVVARVLDHLGLDHDLVRRWSGRTPGVTA